MKNKTRVKNSKKDYQAWLGKVGDDPQGLEDMSESHSPYYVYSTADLLDDAYERLEDLYYGGALKGRQREIVSLLMDGVFNQMDIARKLKIDVTSVRTHLRRIRKKLV